MIPKRIVVRLQTYKGKTFEEKYARAERSFYKLVAKRGAYSPMKKRRGFYSRFPSQYTHGYAVFNSTRGEVMAEWEEQFFNNTQRGKRILRERIRMEEAKARDAADRADWWNQEQELKRILALRNGASRLIGNSAILDILDVPEEVCELQNLLIECKRTLRQKTKTKKEHTT